MHKFLILLGKLTVICLICYWENVYKEHFTLAWKRQKSNDYLTLSHLLEHIRLWVYQFLLLPICNTDSYYFRRFELLLILSFFTEILVYTRLVQKVSYLIFPGRNLDLEVRTLVAPRESKWKGTGHHFDVATHAYLLGGMWHVFTVTITRLFEGPISDLQSNVSSETTFDEDAQSSTTTPPPPPDLPENEPESQTKILESPQNTAKWNYTTAKLCCSSDENYQDE